MLEAAETRHWFPIGTHWDAIGPPDRRWGGRRNGSSASPGGSGTRLPPPGPPFQASGAFPSPIFAWLLVLANPSGQDWARAPSTSSPD
ncbi:hypothetical protein VTJ04DRAFT_2041 [Mycothermus thermophilus]|uniref:uncharacterized protein n=1 Tax=Humicola insolens TaxID=85995 RepID=UPI0037431C74